MVLDQIEMTSNGLHMCTGKRGAKGALSVERSSSGDLALICCIAEVPKCAR